MTQQEIKEFFDWAQHNLRNFEIQECDESNHVYLNDVFIGGWAGDTQKYFIKQNDETAKALRMMEAANEA
ncbi:TPA: hypothetical protein I7E95_002515 [Vibrio cholerae]|nr:hypothetical protein [Vibrio cholerae]